MKTLPLPAMPIAQEKNAVESRLNEIENEMSEAHRDHAFEYWWHSLNLSRTETPKPTFYNLAKDAFNRAHSIYSKEPRIIIERTNPGGMYALYALGVVSGMIISVITFFLITSPN